MCHPARLSYLLLLFSDSRCHLYQPHGMIQAAAKAACLGTSRFTELACGLHVQSGASFHKWEDMDRVTEPHEGDNGHGL